MSIRVMTLVWDASRASGTALLLLLAIADVVDDRGYGFIGQSTLARKTRTSDRTVRRMVGELVELGEVDVVQTGGRRGDHVMATVYRVRLDVLEANRPSCPVGDSQPDTERVPTGQIVRPNRTTVSTLTSVSTSVPTSVDARASEADRLAAALAHCGHDVAAKIGTIEGVIGSFGTGRSWPLAVVSDALMLDESDAGIAALVVEAAGSKTPHRWLAENVRRRAHVDPTRKTPVSDDRHAGRIAQARADVDAIDRLRRRRVAT